MRVTAIINHKGGVAKTATTVNVAAILARDYKRRVLVVDADSQANTSEFFGYKNDTRCTFADMLRRLAVNDPIRPSSFPGVDLLAADESLMDLDLSKVESRSIDVECLRTLLRDRALRYDNVLIDCPPAFNAATAAALLAADDVVIPIKIDAFSLRGMANLMRQIRNMQQINQKLRVAGLLPTMSYKSLDIETSLATLRESKLPVFSPIRRSAKVDDMTFAQTPLIISSPKSAACVDYRRFVVEYIGGDRRGQ